MYKYTYLCICKYVYIFICIYIYICIYKYIYIYVCISKYIYIYIYINVNLKIFTPRHLDATLCFGRFMIHDLQVPLLFRSHRLFNLFSSILMIVFRMFCGFEVIVLVLRHVAAAHRCPLQHVQANSGGIQIG